MQFRRILAFVLFVCLAAALPALAASRTFVSSAGLDTNPCSRDLPCRTFGAALVQTNGDGEIVVLDSAGYGPVIINRGVTIVAPLGVHGAITATSGDAVSVNAGSGKVVLRNLSITGQGAMMAINVVTASGVTIEHCTVSGFLNHGIFIAGPMSGAFTPVVIADTVVRHCGQSGVQSIRAELGMTNCLLTKNGVGVTIPQGTASIRDTVAEGNMTYGFFALAAVPGGTSSIALENCTASHNAYGVMVDGADVTVHGGSATHNGVSGYCAGSAVSTGPSSLTVRNAESSHNNYGVSVGNTAEVTLVACTIAENARGINLTSQTAELRLMQNNITRNPYGINCEVPVMVNSTGDNMISASGVKIQSCGMTTAPVF